MRSIVRLLRLATGLTGSYVGIVVAGVLASVAGLVIPFIIGRATDVVVGALRTGTGPQAVTTVVWLAFALFVVDLVNAVVTNIGGYLGDTTAARLRHQLSTKYYAHLLRLPQSYFDAELSGTIISRLNRSITETTQFLNSFANNFFPMLLTVFGVLAVSAYHSWPLVILLLLIYPIYTWLTTLTSKKWQVWEGQKNALIDAAGGRFAEVIGQIRVVKSFASEQRELDHLDRQYRGVIDTTRPQSRWWHVMDATRRGTLSLIFFAVYALIFAETITGKHTVGQMVLLIQLVNMARQPVMMMSFLVDSAQRAIAGSKDYLAVMAEPVEEGFAPLRVAAYSGAPARTARGQGAGVATDEKRGSAVSAARSDSGGEAPSAISPESSRPGTISPAQEQGPRDKRAATGRSALSPTDTLDVHRPGVAAVEFEDVVFGYGENDDVLHGISFRVDPGEHVAFVSESGGGKSTIVSLLLGLYRPHSGVIRLFGENIADLPRDQVRQAIGVVFQDTALFSGTVAENIAYGRPDASPDEIREASEQAHVHAFVRSFKDGYDALIGERGLRLSGGQKQRIAVARAMLKDAPVLVLDEATSALDTKSERLVQEGLQRLMNRRTSLIIAHRLSTISRVDRIITLRSGVIDEVGSPAALATTDGIYAELLALQASASKRDQKLLRNRYGMRE